MKPFLLKISAVLIAFSLLLIGSDWVLKWHHEPSGKLARKYRALKMDRVPEEIPFTFFLGSSVTNRHINPLLFDSIAGTHSFNLGVNGLAYSPKITVLKSLFAEGFIKRGDEVILEIGLSMPFEDFELNKKFNNNFYRYFYTGTNFQDDWGVVAHSPLDWQAKTQAFWELFCFYLNSRCKYHHAIENIWKEQNQSRKVKSACQYPKAYQHRGFSPYCNSRKANLVNDTTTLYAELRKYVKRGTKLMTQDSLRIYYYMPYERISQWCCQRNIKLSFLIPSTHGINQSELEIAGFLVHQNHQVINLFDPNELPQLFSYKLYYNFGHYNYQGAQLYTKALAQEYLKLTAQNKK